MEFISENITSEGYLSGQTLTVDYANITNLNVLSITGVSSTLHTWTNTSVFLEGQKFVWQSPHGDYRTYIVKSGQTLNVSETPFTNPEKIKRIDGNVLTNSQNYSLRVNSNESQAQKVVVRPSDGKMFSTNINTTNNTVVVIRNYNNSSLVQSLSTTINIGTTIRDIIYIDSLNEVWVCANNRFITRINATTNTIIGGIDSIEATTGGTVIEMFDSTNFVYIHYLDSTNRIQAIDKTTLTSTLIFTSTIANNTTNGIYNESSNCIYAMNPSNRFIIYNLNTLTQTIITDSTNLNQGTISSEIIGNVLYLGVFGGYIVKYDITNPTSPVLIGNIGLFRARSLRYNQKTNHLYVLNGSPGFNTNSAISVVDLENNRVVYSNYIININSNNSILKYNIQINYFGDFVIVPFCTITAGITGNLIYLY